MHELQATRGMVEVAVEAAAAAGARRILTIDLVIGELTSMVDDSVQFYFDILSRGTLAAGAVLRFRRVPAEGQCRACAHEFDVKPPLPRACPRCGSPALEVGGGQEFYVDSIEVDDEGTGGDEHPEGQRPGGALEPVALP
jgi:hydrogenase nickel incorporation protein HypA/HybF